MKRTIAILMAVLMLTALFTACSGTLGMGDGRAYGNVSTTPNGYVNGGENSGYYGSGWNNGSAGSGSYGGSNSGRDSYGSYNGSSSGNSGSSNAGTGMTGGR